MQNSGSPASPGSPESGQPSLEDLFRQLDADSSGNISRKELEHAMKLMYGKPLKAKVIDKMMYDADNDGDGEISYPEFVLMMGACEKQQLESIKLERTMGLWFSIRERGLMPTREQKASRDMTQRRLAAESKRRTAVEKALAEVALRYPQIKFPEWPAPLPDGGGLPPPSQVQQVNVLAPPSPQDRTYDIKASLRRLRVQFGQSADRKTKRKDLESGMIFDADDVADIGCLARWWASLPGPGEAIAIIFDFFDSYAPLIAIMIVPTTWLIKQINALIRPVLDELAGIPPDYVAPPPPPASPDVMQAAVKSFFDLAQAEPATYLALDLGLAFAIGALAFFWKDIMDWLEARRLRAAANAKKAAASGDYQQLENEEEEEEEVMSAQALRMDLYKCINVSEELEIKLRVYKSRGSDAATRELTVQLEEQQAKRVELEKLLKEIGGAEEEEASAKPAQATAKSEFSIFMNNMSAGIVEVTVYFADIISDVQVLMLLYNTGNVVSAALSLLFLIAQFFVIYIRVLPYLSTTFGKESYIYLIYLWTGFPIGSLGLDVLMFLEPFGLLAVLPLPTWLKTFVPSYKATRVICEVFIESLPQTLLQSYILIAVMGRVHAGTAGPNDIALLPNVASLPQSITISTLSTLKTWIGLVDEANKAGISIKAKAWQLWNVGGGLPLDALKKGAIDTWTCGYKLDDGEISPLINALEDNASLVTLNLAASGMTWDQEDSSGAPLVAAIASNPTALAGLQTLIISERTECKLPIDQMRMGGSTAMNSLQTMEFFKPGGPWHDEVLLLGEVLRRDRQVTVFPESAKKAGEKIIKLMEEVSSGHVTREAWELRVKQFMVEGHARRSHLQSLISIEVLRGVSFGAKELHDGGISLSQLRAGCFTVSELKADIGVEVRTLKDLGYSLQEMREGSVTAEELKPFGYSAGEMREGTFVPPELKSAGYTLAEMKEAGFSATDLKTAEFTATQLRKVGYKAAHCRKAEYKPTEMRTAKFTAVEMRDGGFSATKIRMAGYDAAEATTAFDLVTLKEAGYVSRELREAGHSVSDMSGVGFTLEELYGGGYSVEALRGFGFTMAELKAVGASLAKMKESGATVGQLRGAGYTAARLKTQDYSALEMMDGGFTSTDMEKAGFDSRLIKELLNGKTTAEALKEEGFSAKELRAGNFKAADLKGCFPVKVLRAVGYSETNLRDAGFEEWLIESVSGQSTGELRANGFTADQLKTAGYSGSELAEGGYTASELQASGFSASELRLAGLSATLLREAGCSLKELKAAYYSVGELQEAEFTDSELRAAGFTASEFYESDVSAVTLRAVGFSVEELKSGGFSAKDIKGPGQWDKSVLRDLKNANFSAKELKNSGLTAAELRSVDFTVKELEAAGFGGKELKAAGFNGADLRSVGFQAGGLKAVGYTAGELKAGGFSVQELKDGGFGANDLRVAKISPIELKAAGFTAAQLRSEGFSAKELTGGFTSAELKAVGYSARELHQGGIYYPEIKAIGFTAQELRNEGFSPKELRLCGFLARELRNIGCTLAELTAGEYPPLVVQAVDGRSSIALKGDGFTAEILWTAGFSAKELKEALFDAVLLKSVGYSAEDMRKGGFPLRVLLRDAAYTSVELKGAGFSATDFLAAPCSVTELKGAGFSATQCVEAGLNQAVVAAIYRRRTQKERKALQRTGAHWLTLIRNEGFTCEQAKNGGLLPSDCHQAGYSYEEARALGFSRRIDDWVTMDIKNPYNKWG